VARLVTQFAAIPQDGLRPVLAVSRLSKTFDATTVLSSLELTVGPGEIHALLGENGSGKSTLIKILAGYHRPDAGGEILLDGRPLSFGSAESSYELGCRFVHQDLGLVETSSIIDNLSLNGGFPSRWATIRPKEVLRLASEDLAGVGLDVDPRSTVATLSPAEKTGVAVARALRRSKNAPVKLLVLDEPTAALPEGEVEQLLTIARSVATRGVGVLYVTHRLDEIFGLANNITILRDGHKVAQCPVSSVNRRELITMLVGREFDEVQTASAELATSTGSPIIEVRDLEAGPLKGVSFSARRGEIVGVAGITGSGRDVLLGVLFGASARTAGSVLLAGQELAAHRPDLAMGKGVAYMPADRKIHGGIMSLSARENLSLTHLAPFWRNGPLLRRRAEKIHAQDWLSRLEVRPVNGMEKSLSAFSGGNQQKILFGKWLRRGPQLLLVDEPTQGVDVGAKAGLHAQVIGAAKNGVAVMVSSSDVDELAALCQRILVMRNGTIVAHLEGDAISPKVISRAMLGTDEKVNQT
jgi:ribose transport system ATP-binding protein